MAKENTCSSASLLRFAVRRARARGADEQLTAVRTERDLVSVLDSDRNVGYRYLSTRPCSCASVRMTRLANPPPGFETPFEDTQFGRRRSHPSATRDAREVSIRPVMPRIRLMA